LRYRYNAEIGKLLKLGADMALEEYKSTLKRGRRKLRPNPLHASDPMRLSIHERLREKRFAACSREILLMTLDNRLDSLIAEFVLDFDALTNAGGYPSAIDSLTENKRAAINYAFKHAVGAMKCAGVMGTNIIEDLQLRAKKLLADPVQLIRLQCSGKWWHA
jgi:hypothetical protein